MIRYEVIVYLPGMTRRDAWVRTREEAQAFLDEHRDPDWGWQVGRHHMPADTTHGTVANKSDKFENVSDLFT